MSSKSMLLQGLNKQQVARVTNEESKSNRDLCGNVSSTVRVMKVNHKICGGKGILRACVSERTVFSVYLGNQDCQ